MQFDPVPDNDYLLLTPGPLSTSKAVRAAMLKDSCTWDTDYNQCVQRIRGRLVRLATKSVADYSAVLMQGSGTFSVESTLLSSVPDNGTLLVIANGAYGRRMQQIAKAAKLQTILMGYEETLQPNPDEIEQALKTNRSITHVALVHCETTTGILNPLMPIAKIVKTYGKTLIVDAMSSFGGVPMDIGELGVDFLVSSANKCMQGVPGFGFVIARREALEKAVHSRSLSLDLHAQWCEMEQNAGKWRFTSPTHVVKAFEAALEELDIEGGIAARHLRYTRNQKALADGMRELGFFGILDAELQSPIITSFYYPNESFDFQAFYKKLKAQGFVIYPGKLSNLDTFRIGNIGEVYLADIARLLCAIKEAVA